MGEQRIESVGHFEMLYDCEHCGTKALLAKTQRHCAECGAPQNPDKRYFPEEGEAKRVDGHVYDGADRHCPSCNAAMGAKAKNCTQCGAPLDGSKEVRGVAAFAPAPPKKRNKWLPIVLAVGAIALIVFSLWFFVFRTKNATLKVTAHRWERSIGIEVYGEQQESDWRDRMPSDARNSSCVRKERSKRQVDTGREDCKTERKDKKDGTYEQIKKCTPIYRSEPVDDDWCRYTVRRWKALDPLRTSGIGMTPVWPAGDLPPAEAAAVMGARRQGKRTEKLILDIGKDSCDVSEATWKKYKDGQDAKVEIRARSGAVVCSSL